MLFREETDMWKYEAQAGKWYDEFLGEIKSLAGRKFEVEADR